MNPGKNCLPKAVRVLNLAARNGFNLDRAKQGYQQQSQGVDVPWDDNFVDELKKGLLACRVMCVSVLFALLTESPVAPTILIVLQLLVRIFLSCYYANAQQSHLPSRADESIQCSE